MWSACHEPAPRALPAAGIERVRGGGVLACGPDGDPAAQEAPANRSQSERGSTSSRIRCLWGAIDRLRRGLRRADDRARRFGIRASRFVRRSITGRRGAAKGIANRWLPYWHPGVASLAARSGASDWLARHGGSVGDGKPAPARRGRALPRLPSRSIRGSLRRIPLRAPEAV